MSADTNTYQPAAIPDEGTATQVYRIVIKATLVKGLTEGA